jgi:poly(hydroxyalkanoate) depolymerase family esterase
MGDAARIATTSAAETVTRADAESLPSKRKALDMNDMLDPNKMAEATRLTRAGRLTEAVALLQRMLRVESPRDMTFATAVDIVPSGQEPPIIDGPAKSEEMDRPLSSSFGIDSRPANRPLASAATAAQRHMFPKLGALVGRLGSGLGLHGLLQQARVPTPDIVPEGGQFITATYSNTEGTRAYKLYIPSGYHGQALPLVVMLHGGAQSPDDFAAGTRMNLIAEEQACLVVYPAQPGEANASKCWNWFRPSDQRRDQGEPSLIAGITRQVMRDYSVDPQRVYIGGLSAGAATAAVMGATYPDVYAAIGVHSGLAYGAANDIPSAFAAMRDGELSASSRSGDTSAVPGDGSAVPTIVFHGDQDTVVHPRNGNQFIAQNRMAKSQTKVQRGQVPGGRSYTRTIHTDASGQAIFEHWNIHGAGHAWSGGSPSGSYTDPLGPDATREMLRFFLEHQNPPAASERRSVPNAVAARGGYSPSNDGP